MKFEKVNSKASFYSLSLTKSNVLLNFFLMLYETQPYTVYSAFLHPLQQPTKNIFRTKKLISNYRMLLKKEMKWLLCAFLKTIQHFFLLLNHQ